MNITITGSLGNIGERLTKSLIEKGHHVKVVSSTQERAAAIAALGATPVVGTVQDERLLQAAFAGADAVYTMVPPDPTATDVRAAIRNTGVGYAAAIKQAGVPYVVNLSSIGAHRPDGAGPTGANHYVEQQLNALADTHVLHLRPGMFYTNFLGAIPMVRHQGIIGHNFEAGVKMALSHPQDIAAAAFAALDGLDFSGKQVLYIAGDVQSGAAVAAALGAAIGRPELAWMAFPDEALLQALLQNGMSEAMARVYVLEIGMALRDGSLLEDYLQQQEQAVGSTRLADFAKEFAGIYSGN